MCGQLLRIFAAREKNAGLSRLCPRPSRGVPNMKYSHPILEGSIENFVWMADERHDAHARPLSDRCCGFGMFGEVRNDRSNSRFERNSYTFAKFSAVGGYFTKIGQCLFRVLNLHAPRKVRNAASTSCSLATPLRSASSTACNSSGVA